MVGLLSRVQLTISLPGPVSSGYYWKNTNQFEGDVAVSVKYPKKQKLPIVTVTLLDFVYNSTRK